MGIARLTFGLLAVSVAGGCSETPPAQGMQPVLDMGMAGMVAQPPAGAGTGAAGQPGMVSTIAGTGSQPVTGGASGGASLAGSSALPPAGQAGSAAPPAPGGDADADGKPDGMDNCPMLANADQKDSDGDMRGDACDNCAGLANPDQADANMDGEGDACSCETPKVACANGMAGPYPCSGVDMLSRIPLNMVGAKSGASIWGAVESKNKREIAIMATDAGTAFVDLSKPRCPAVVGFLPAATQASQWREARALGDIAVIVSEAQNHGLQVFDMKKLGTMPSTAKVMADVVYKGDSSAVVGNAHNVFAHEPTKMVYVVGARSCSGGLHMVDFKDPMNPKFAGCGTTGLYAHDVTCIMYKGPDTQHMGKEICVTYNGQDSAFSVVDVTDKASPKTLSTTKYMQGAYSHQGWFTEDQKTMLLADELDETNFRTPTKTYIFDMTDLDAPKALKIHMWNSMATEHNVYIKGQRAYFANYTEGLRMLDVSDAANAVLKEVAFFDTNPMSSSVQMRGAWGAYPYFPSGVIAIGDMVSGLFLVQPQPASLGIPTD